MNDSNGQSQVDESCLVQIELMVPVQRGVADIKCAGGMAGLRFNHAAITQWLYCGDFCSSSVNVWMKTCIDL